MIPFSADELYLLQGHVLPLHKHINSGPLAESSKTLGEVESSLNKIKSERSTRSWAKKTRDFLTYVGYTAILAIILCWQFVLKIFSLGTK